MLAILLLAAEKHKATFIAPIGIGLALFVSSVRSTHLPPLLVPWIQSRCFSHCCHLIVLSCGFHPPDQTDRQVAELLGVYYTGGSLNPARSFGPSVVLRTFETYRRFSLVLHGALQTHCPNLSLAWTAADNQTGSTGLDPFLELLSPPGFTSCL
jgi:hypothetical protein